MSAKCAFVFMYARACVARVCVRSHAIISVLYARQARAHLKALCTRGSRQLTTPRTRALGAKSSTLWRTQTQRVCISTPRICVHTIIITQTRCCGVVVCRVCALFERIMHVSECAAAAGLNGKRAGVRVHSKVSVIAPFCMLLVVGAYTYVCSVCMRTRRCVP